MTRSKENITDRLREQMDFLRSSLRGFFEGNFAESVRIATAIRVLVHETGMSKPLLKLARPNGLDLQILEHAGERENDGEEIFSFAVSVRVDPGSAVSPSVDLGSSHCVQTSIGAWWNRTVFASPSDSKQMVYTRRKVILILANKEGGAHVHAKEDPAYVKLLTDQPLTFSVEGLQVSTPDLARCLTAQSGAEMLECLKRNFFPDADAPLKWDFGVVPPVSFSLNQISGRLVTQAIYSLPWIRSRITKRP